MRTLYQAEILLVYTRITRETVTAPYDGEGERDVAGGEYLFLGHTTHASSGLRWSFHQ
jgi:hypothetical protein